MGTRMSKTYKDIKQEKDRAWRTKGHPHPVDDLLPIPCRTCGGMGFITKLGTGEIECPDCMGTGEDYERG